MARTGTSTDPLLEILSLCEQALTDLNCARVEAPESVQPDNLIHSPPGRRANVVRRLILIQGGLSTPSRRTRAR